MVAPQRWGGIRCGKMAEELLSLKWNNHQAHFVDILTFLREQEIFVDATLACGGKLYAAHKFVLSTCSDYFKQMFTKNPSKHPIVFMKDVTSRDLEALLDFMYNGEVNVPQSSLGSLIKTAEGLQIKGLAVPDDPPAPKRDRDREREKRENRSQLDHHSPPAKRPRPRERSPPQSSPSQSQATQPSSHPPAATQLSRSRSPQPPATSGSSQVGMPPVEATLDEDSRTSIQSGLSGLSEQNASTTPSLSAKPGGGNCQQQQQQANAGDGATSQVDALAHGHSGEEPSPGPSGLHKQQQSKEEPEFEIKQEDVVDLGEDDEGDWGVEGDGGGGESSLGTENPPNFPEVMLPHSDGTMPATGDPAMSVLFDSLTNLHSSLGFGSLPAPSTTPTGDPFRPYACHICGKRFKLNHHLKQHSRIHTGERPFACNLCGKTFTQQSSYHYHMKKKLCGPHPSTPGTPGTPEAPSVASPMACGVPPKATHQTGMDVGMGGMGGGLLPDLSPHGMSGVSSSMSCAGIPSEVMNAFVSLTNSAESALGVGGDLSTHPSVTHT
ncbi:longitudinals lacking protein, isoforms H/M/V-like isoform X4 [Portunus trituberculatus]|uniref:longitudinals lacking protein, isoforms H/M/V-like isoform X4 n=1 Tax=Portunus trituberculatus TaxID=210409 RepID=UPI001E1CE957|nr:longitudinals lacking protein, isoforms H/M/V-like isoform X4 [Portunus trituberculatus]